MDWTVITVCISSRSSDGRAACLADHAGGPREAKEAFVLLTTIGTAEDCGHHLGGLQHINHVTAGGWCTAYHC